MIVTRTPFRITLGGGGTDLRVGLAALTRERVDVVVVVTDGDTPWPETAPVSPVIVVLVGAGTAVPPAWARVVRASKE